MEKLKSMCDIGILFYFIYSLKKKLQQKQAPLFLITFLNVVAHITCNKNAENV